MNPFKSAPLDIHQIITQLSAIRSEIAKHAIKNKNAENAARLLSGVIGTLKKNENG